MIETRALRYEYPAGPVLSFYDVDVRQGGVLLLQGKSGSGKSTWLALAAGLLTPAAGEVVVANQPLSKLSHGKRDAWRARTIGFLPQKLHLSDAMSVERNLALSYFAAGVPENLATIRRALMALGVRELAQRRPSQLSGGQLQRVALARTILMEPKVILADEPTASLDDESAAIGLKLLRDCATQCNATLVIATHDARVQQAFPAAVVHLMARRQAAALS
ncbi:MAG TPA: ATP-binding cassette domain-containing protein [Ramlibacter sp.]|uniref:ABC transporter ATP-binding protein n=1 Tax=Ramlibacter sp. TaxID=1917967 RepID=UPI002C36D243|nr:ATP-binding cassette domain-containing protein [Ramlibacter sp.]HVZ46640.1 ATP-binding cassette domain-containing protein [Ramlibacter sp.]